MIMKIFGSSTYSNLTQRRTFFSFGCLSFCLISASIDLSLFSKLFLSNFIWTINLTLPNIIVVDSSICFLSLLLSSSDFNPTRSHSVITFSKLFKRVSIITYLFLLWTRNFLAEFKPLGLPLPILLDCSLLLDVKSSINTNLYDTYITSNNTLKPIINLINILFMNSFEKLFFTIQTRRSEPLNLGDKPLDGQKLLPTSLPGFLDIGSSKRGWEERW